MAFDDFLSALAAVIPALLLAASVYIYASLVRQIRVRVDGAVGDHPSRACMRWPEANRWCHCPAIFLQRSALSLRAVTRSKPSGLAIWW